MLELSMLPKKARSREHLWLLFDEDNKLVRVEEWEGAEPKPEWLPLRAKTAVKVQEEVAAAVLSPPQE